MQGNGEALKCDSLEWGFAHEMTKIPLSRPSLQVEKNWAWGNAPAWNLCRFLLKQLLQQVRYSSKTIETNHRTVRALRLIHWTGGEF